MISLAAGCQPMTSPLPTRAALAGEAQVAGESTADPPGVPPTWTAVATAVATYPSPAPLDTRAPTQTSTPWPTLTPTQPPATLPPMPTLDFPTETPTPFAFQPTATATPPPVTGPNLLPNPSFEGGWYHIDGIPELQIADNWQLEWDAGGNPLDPDPWNVFVRPEARVLTTESLPRAEHALFIWDGSQTVKVFKGQGAISFRYTTEVTLEPGAYLFVVNLFPDLVVGYTATGQKIWAPDPLSGEVQFIVGPRRTPWHLPVFGRKNTLTHVFAVDEAQTLRLGIGIRGRWAIDNNGWFLDDWSLRRLADE